MFRACQMCCIFFIGATFILAASRSDKPHQKAPAHSDSDAPQLPAWVTAFPNG